MTALKDFYQKLGLSEKGELPNQPTPTLPHVISVPSSTTKPVLTSPENSPPFKQSKVDRILHDDPERVRYIHIRFHDEEGNIQNHGGATISYYRSADMRVFYYAIALCRANENFCRMLGRRISTGKMDAGRGYSVNVEASAPSSQFIESIAKFAALKLIAKKNPSITPTEFLKRIG